jgi:hypothetical protein
VVRQQALGLGPVSRGCSLRRAGTAVSDFAGERWIPDKMRKSRHSSPLRRRAYAVIHLAIAMAAGLTGGKIMPLSSTAFLDVMGLFHPESEDAMQSDQCRSSRPMKICKMKRPIVSRKLPRMSQIKEGICWSASDLYRSLTINRRTFQKLRKNSRRLSCAQLGEKRGEPSSTHNAV